VEYLESGHSIDVFLDDFPTVTRRQAQEVLTLLGRECVEQVAT
jgi:uncharacterized protein (DUF433 family)